MIEAPNPLCQATPPLFAKGGNNDADTSLPVRDRTQTGALERQIDEMVHALYGLTPDEIEIAKEKSKS